MKWLINVVHPNVATAKTVSPVRVATVAVAAASVMRKARNVIARLPHRAALRLRSKKTTTVNKRTSEQALNDVTDHGYIISGLPSCEFSENLYRAGLLKPLYEVFGTAPGHLQQNTFDSDVTILRFVVGTFCRQRSSRMASTSATDIPFCTIAPEQISFQGAPARA